MSPMAFGKGPLVRDGGLFADLTVPSVFVLELAAAGLADVDGADMIKKDW